MSLGFRHLALLCAGIGLAGCGSSVDGPGEAAPPAPTSSPAAATDAASGTSDGADRSGGGTPARARNADGSPLEVTGRDLCADLPAAAAAEALGVPVDEARPGDTATPQCTYSYTNADGRDSTFTLAAMRPADIGGRTGVEAFDYMVQLSRGLAGPVDLDQADLAAGDKAVRITGGDLHTAVVASGGHLLTVTVPERDADTAAVDALVTVVARALAA